jgi:hypothetical protein
MPYSFQFQIINPENAAGYPRITGDLSNWYFLQLLFPLPPA